MLREAINFAVTCYGGHRSRQGALVLPALMGAWGRAGQSPSGAGFLWLCAATEPRAPDRPGPACSTRAALIPSRGLEGVGQSPPQRRGLAP